MISVQNFLKTLLWPNSALSGNFSLKESMMKGFVQKYPSAQFIIYNNENLEPLHPKLGITTKNYETAFKNK